MPAAREAPEQTELNKRGRGLWISGFIEPAEERAVLMITVTLKSGDKKTITPGETIFDIAAGISENLAKAACCAKVDGMVMDLRTTPWRDSDIEILTFEDEDGRKAFRHTAAHVLAQAVKRIYPEAKLAIGPATDSGFYYDFDVPKPFTQDDIEKIEEEMRRIVKEGHAPERFALERREALALMAGEPYKIELINGLPESETITFYKQGGFTDLCAGPHLMNVKGIKAFKLTGVAGAYWRGNERNKMLCRVYGAAFPKQSELDEYLKAVEDAKARDHNKLGRELGFFTTVDYIGQGLPILMPKGAKVIQLLQRFVEDEEEKRGYLLTKTPFMAKRDLYKISGHWDHYRDGMFVLAGKDVMDDPEREVLALRPMTCPFQFQVYLSKTRSYRDLPLRYNETSTLFRNEASGEMHGLIRVRQFTISEGHLACRPDQLEAEFKGCMDLARFMLKTLGLDGDVRCRFSKWDPENKEKYIGDARQWENVQDIMRSILDGAGVDYREEAGEAAFYGPKLDFEIKNVYGKEDTLITIQIDFQLAERFGMEYADSDGTKKHPYVIHRTSIGCYERVLAMLLEKTAGSLPVWLSPTQAAVLPISDKFADYAESVAAEISAAGIRVEVDRSTEKIGYKIRQARNERIPYILVVGEKEREAGLVSIRSRAGDEGQGGLRAFIERVKDDVSSKR
jgi:threonyl-tRNA synthetase